MEVQVQQEAFDIGTETANFSQIAAAHHAGAIASFIGLVRDYREETSLQAMRLQHYPGMTERILGELVTTAKERFDLSAVRLIHRYGLLQSTEPIVLVMVASPHRTAAFNGCSYLMDRLKTDAPFWKCEYDDKGQTHWVEAKNTDVAKAQKWDID